MSIEVLTSGISKPVASISITGLSETDIVTATNGTKTLTGKWTQISNPAAHGLPDGYTELECIIGGSTQYINTGFTPNQDTRVILDHKFIGNTDNMIGFGSRADATSRGFLYAATFNSDRAGAFVQYGGTYADAGNLYGLERHIVDFNKNNFYHDKVLKKTFSYTSFTAPDTLCLFAYNENGTPILFSDMVLYSCQIYDNGQIVRDFVPAKRNSDSVVGLYDIVNGIFYENAGTGTFTAGAEVPQIINGFLIKPIRDLGTWTVTATDGEETIIQDVLIDVITKYEIKMYYHVNYLMLYDFGDECEEITGGWSDPKTFEGNAVIKKNDRDISIKSAILGGSNPAKQLAYTATLNKVDISAYNSLHAKAVTNAVYSSEYGHNVSGLIAGTIDTLSTSYPMSFKDYAIFDGEPNTDTLPYIKSDSLGYRDSSYLVMAFQLWTFVSPSGSIDAKYQALWLTAEDDWKTLCRKAGIDAPENLTTLIGDTESIRTILANENAIRYMIANCTGSFMTLFIESSDCLSALEASPYKELIYANKHWSKFLAMVQ